MQSISGNIRTAIGSLESVDADVSFTMTIPAETGRIQPAVDLVSRRIRPLGYPQPIRDFDIPLAVTEALANAVVHGSGRDPSKYVTLAIEASPEIFTCTVSDEGPGFDPGSGPDAEPSDEPATHGRGLMLIKNLMTEVVFRAAGKEIQMTLRLTPTC